MIDLSHDDRHTSYLLLEMNDLDIQLLKISSLFSDQLLPSRLVLLEVDPHLDHPSAFSYLDP